MRKTVSFLPAIIGAVSLICSCCQETACSDNPYKVTQEHRDRAAALVSQMTLEEKCDYIGGSKDGFYIRPIDRLGIPLIRMADGPQGVRNNTKSTLFACGVAAAATWNEDVTYEMGVALGQDSRARGVHILLGPGVNIYRSPLCGRNFEYMGEDPLLSSRTAVQYIKGVQSQGVMATVKHFALNNQEFNRHHVSSDADERTINEIYFPAFEKAVKKAFPPEFINRVDEQVFFSSLTKDDIARIIDIELKGLKKRVKEAGYELNITAAAKRFVADAGYDPSYGARPLKRAIQKYIEDPVSEHIIAGRMLGKSPETMSDGCRIKVSLTKDKENVTVEWA